MKHSLEEIIRQDVTKNFKYPLMQRFIDRCLLLLSAPGRLSERMIGQPNGYLLASSLALSTYYAFNKLYLNKEISAGGAMASIAFGSGLNTTLASDPVEQGPGLLLLLIPAGYSFLKFIGSGEGRTDADIAFDLSMMGIEYMTYIASFMGGYLIGGSLNYLNSIWEKVQDRRSTISKS